MRPRKLSLPVAVVLAALCIAVGLGVAGFFDSQTPSNDLSDLEYVAGVILERLYLDGVFVPTVAYADPLISEERTLFLISDVDAVVADRMIRSLAYLDAQSPGEPITIHIDTEGGSHGVAIANFIQTMQSPVNTVALNWAVSAGAIVLAAGTGERLALPNSTIMVHSFPGRENQYSDVEYSQKELWYATETAFWNLHSDIPEENVLGRSRTRVLFYRPASS